MTEKEGWERREVLIEKFVRDTGEDREKVSDALDAMIDDGVMERRFIDGDEYVRAKSDVALLKYLMKYKSKSVGGSIKDRITDAVNRRDKDE